MRIKIKKILIFILIFSSVSLKAKSYAGLMADLDRTEFETGKLQEKIDKLDSSIKMQTEAVASLESEFKTRQDLIKAKEKILKERLRSLLFFSVPERIGFIMTTDDFDNISRGEAILAKMLKMDLKEHDKLSKDADEVSSIKVLVEQDKTKLEQSRLLQSNVLEDLKKKLARKKVLIEKAKKTTTSYLAFVTRREKNSKKIENIALQGSKNQINPATYLDAAPAVSNLVPPLKGKIIGGFGRLWDVKIKNWIYNRGVTVEAVYGSKVSAVDSGVVSFSGWIPAYGRVLIVAHSNGLFSVYGHLSRLFFDNGDKVQKGSVVAQTGDSGSAEKPSLYFELRNAINNIDPTHLFH